MISRKTRKFNGEYRRRGRGCSESWDTVPANSHQRRGSLILLAELWTCSSLTGQSGGARGSNSSGMRSDPRSSNSTPPGCIPATGRCGRNWVAPSFCAIRSPKQSARPPETTWAWLCAREHSVQREVIAPLRFALGLKGRSEAFSDILAGGGKIMPKSTGTTPNSIPRGGIEPSEVVKQTNSTGSQTRPAEVKQAIPLPETHLECAGMARSTRQDVLA